MGWNGKWSESQAAGKEAVPIVGVRGQSYGKRMEMGTSSNQKTNQPGLGDHKNVKGEGEAAPQILTFIKCSKEIAGGPINRMRE